MWLFSVPFFPVTFSLQSRKGILKSRIYRREAGVKSLLGTKGRREVKHKVMLSDTYFRLGVMGLRFEIRDLFRPSIQGALYTYDPYN